MDLWKGLPPDGPITLINVHETRCTCDALTLVSGVDAPVHIPLDNFAHELASELRERLGNFLSSSAVRYWDVDRSPRSSMIVLKRKVRSISFSTLEALRRRVW